MSLTVDDLREMLFQSHKKEVILKTIEQMVDGIGTKVISHLDVNIFLPAIDLDLRDVSPDVIYEKILIMMNDKIALFEELLTEEIIIKFNSPEMPFIVSGNDEKNKALILPFRT